VLVDEVLVGELGAVDRLATSACGQMLRLVSDCSLLEAPPRRLGLQDPRDARKTTAVCSRTKFCQGVGWAFTVHVGEVTALDHEVGDDAVEGAALRNGGRGRRCQLVPAISQASRQNFVNRGHGW
jgi:hypothetical protein